MVSVIRLNDQLLLFCMQVRLALDKTISVYLSLRGTDLQARRQSTFSGCQPQRIASGKSIK